MQLGHMRWASFGCRQLGQTCTRGEVMACVARRLSRLAFEVFFFGTAMRAADTVADVACKSR